MKSTIERPEVGAEVHTVGIESNTVLDSKYIGKPLLRPEDKKFLTGRAKYVDDVQLPGMVFCAFLRSPHSHARILHLSTKAAKKNYP